MKCLPRLLAALLGRIRGHRIVTLVDHKPGRMTEIDVCRRCHRPLATRARDHQYPLPRDLRAFVR